VVKTVPFQGRTVRKKRPVQLYISKGPENILAPDLYLHTEEEARIMLRELGLKINWVREYNDEVPEGKIFKQVPRADLPVSREEEMVVYVSLGGRPFNLSTVIGLMSDQAVDYLEREGLKPRLRYEPADQPAGTVVAQFPEPGSPVQPGQSVDLVISSGPGEQAGDTDTGDDGGAGN
jgi:beta-lactam-binding protein with PASTA domain